ncbi:hypothetical protein C8R45DRAFT_1113046 [Mycena sanguinolenta]|nr:hypothetical protein C8R45DRAFT_1113046 [Mycena sanguinolenta]
MSSSTVTPPGLLGPQQRLASSLVALDHVIPPELVPRIFNDTAILTRRIAFLQAVHEHIINLSNQLNAFSGFRFPAIPIPPSVFDIYTERKMQKRQIYLRLKNILNITDEDRLPAAEVLQRAHGRILDLIKALQAYDPDSHTAQTQPTLETSRVIGGDLYASATQPLPSQAPPDLGATTHEFLVLPESLVRDQYSQAMAVARARGNDVEKRTLPGFEYILRSERLGYLERAMQNPWKFARG